MSSMTPLPVATESIPIPEPAKVPPIDLQRIDGIETQIHVQREDLDNLKAGQIELSSLIESLRVELQRVTQPQAKLKPTSDRGAPSRRLEAIRSPAPPFLVESVDTWGSEKRIVVKTPQGRRELKSGDSYAGWTAQGGSDANHAAFRDPEGHAIRLGVTWK